MLVQPTRFAENHKRNPSAEIMVYSHEKTTETVRLLAAHGLEDDIRHGSDVNSYYDDPHDATGRFDFALANPPFNVAPLYEHAN